MTSNSLTVRDKLKVKWIVLIGAAIALLGILLSAVDHVAQCGIYIGSDTGWFLNTPIFSYTDINGFRTVSTVLDSHWLSWLCTLVSFHLLPAIGTLLAVLAMSLFLFYVLKGHRMVRGTVLLSLSLLTLSAGVAWITLCDLINWILGILRTTIMNNGFEWDAFLTECLFAFQVDSARLVDVGIGLLIGGGLLIGAVTLLLSPRLGKVFACVGVSASALLVPVNFVVDSDTLFRMFRPVGDMNNPTVVWIPSYISFGSTDVLNVISAVCMLLFCVVFVVLLIANRLTPVFQKKKS